MAKASSAYDDSQHWAAPPESSYAKIIMRLVGDHHEESGFDFNYKTYPARDVNAFAMADGTIRILPLPHGYSQWWRTSIRYRPRDEAYTAMKHIHKKLQQAYGSTAVREAISSIDGWAGDIARSQLGGLEMSQEVYFEKQQISM
jgi:putative metalloprotease